MPCGEAANGHFVDRRKPGRRLANCGHGHRRSELDRISINSGTDRREGNRNQLILSRDFQTAAIARGKQLRLACIATLPDRPDRMDDMASRQPVTFSQSGLARRTPTQLATLAQEIRARCPMFFVNNSAASEKGGVRGVDNSVDL